MKRLILTTLALAFTLGTAHAQLYKLRGDTSTPDNDLRDLTFMQAATPRLGYYQYENGALFTNIASQYAEFSYGTSGTAVAFVTVSNTSLTSASGLFTFNLSSVNVNTNGTFWYTVLVREGSSIFFSGKGDLTITETTVTGAAGDLGPLLTPINYTNYTYENVALSGPYLAGTGLAFRVANSSGQVVIDSTADSDVTALAVTQAIHTAQIASLQAQIVSNDNEIAAIITNIIALGTVDTNLQAQITTNANGVAANSATGATHTIQIASNQVNIVARVPRTNALELSIVPETTDTIDLNLGTASKKWVDINVNAADDITLSAVDELILEGANKFILRGGDLSQIVPLSDGTYTLDIGFDGGIDSRWQRINLEATTDGIYLNTLTAGRIYFNTHLIPQASNTLDAGSETAPLRSVYASALAAGNVATQGPGTVTAENGVYEGPHKLEPFATPHSFWLYPSSIQNNIANNVSTTIALDSANRDSDGGADFANNRYQFVGLRTSSNCWDVSGTVYLQNLLTDKLVRSFLYFVTDGGATTQLMDQVYGVLTTRNSQKVQAFVYPTSTNDFVYLQLLHVNGDNAPDIGGTVTGTETSMRGQLIEEYE